MLPAGAPAAIVERLNREVVAILNTAEARDALDKQGVVVETGTPAALGARIRADVGSGRTSSPLPASAGSDSTAEGMDQIPPVLAARSASHHQTAGNAAAPYSGNTSGRPKRFQRAAETLS